MIKLFTIILQFLARAYLWHFRPKIVAVTGNTGKTSTKEAIGTVLRGAYRTRVSAGNLNTDLGVSLTILGNWGEEYYQSGGGLFFWLKVLGWSLTGGWFNQRYPSVLVLEYAADRPGDIERLARKFKPQVAVVTAVSAIPVHVEYFSGPQALAREKVKILTGLSFADFAVLNVDELVVWEMRTETKASIWGYGFGDSAKVKLSDFHLAVGPEEEPQGVEFKISFQNNSGLVKINGVLGRSQAWASGAAVAVGLILGMNLAEISQALGNYQGLPGRLRILPGLKNSWIIDDTYNAAPASLHLALDTLKEIPAQRKIAVLGDMLELGQYAPEAHQAAGNQAGTIVDWLITVGSQAKFIAQAAGNQIRPERILSFNTSAEAAEKTRAIIAAGDLILVKGSQGIRMEKVVEAIMTEPQKKSQLLVRQSKKWLNKI